MSHFAVLVASNKKEDVTKLLAPFQENNMGDCPKEYLEFNDYETQFLEDYNTKTMRQIKTPYGTVLSPFDEHFKRIDNTGMFPSTKYVVPEGYTEIEVPRNEVYKTFDEYVKDYECFEERDPVTNRYGHWENPNRKWDWYQEGGRYSKSIKDVNGNWVTSELKKNLDFSMDMEKYNDSLRFWELYIEKQEPINEKDNELIKWCFYKETYYTKRYKSKEDYAKSQASIAFYAFLDSDGNWYERGEMGWFGISIEEPDKVQDFLLGFYDNFIKDLDDNTVLTVIDCHI